MTRSLIALTAVLFTACDLLDEDYETEETSEECNDVMKVTFYADGDGDGFGTEENSKDACEAPAGYVETSGDCDDQDVETSPDAAEVCDGIDNNCDSVIDEDLTEVFYADLDGDGYGDEADIIEACEVPSGYAAEAGDCDDDNADLNEFCTAQVRFVNVNPDLSGPTLHVDVDSDGSDDASATLDFSEGSDYTEIPPGDASLYVTSSDGSEVVRVSFPFTAGESYSFAFLSQPGIMIKWNDTEDIASDVTRINLRNVHQDGDVTGWWGYWNGTGYPVDHSYDLGANAEEIYELPAHGDSVQLEAIFESEDDLLVDWEAQPLVSGYTGQLLDVYILTEGDCSFLSTTCQPWLIVQAEDGSTFTLEESFGWAL